ncbi:MAG: DUF1844 domain-containing protein [Ignavibacteria bacterium]|nr:DUF1844 domain-containing protein [Ignavibacteria bacterium]
MDKERSSQLFISLVYTWQMQAMIQLGKIANPVDGSSQRDLDAAQVTIDILDMLKEKTLNNLDDNEKRFLEQTISDLKLNYVDERNKPEPADSSGDSPGEVKQESEAGQPKD